MKRLVKNLLARRFIWFLIGLLLVPGFRAIRAVVHPTAKDAMGFVGYYEESYSVFTFLGDYSYSLAFRGDKERFEKYAERLGLDDHMVSGNECREEASDGQWSRGVVFDPDDSMIQYFSTRR